MVIEALKIIGDEVVVEFRDFATKHESSGSLARSIKYKIVGKTLYVTMNKYAAYLDAGTKPHPVPPQALRRWAKKKGLNEYAVAANIKKYGTKAYPFLYRFEEIIKENLRNISKEAAKNLTTIVVNQFNELNSIN